MVCKGRPKTFENSEALEKAKELFWEKGYEATSLSELIERMGISRQSLYNTFGNKHSLFISCLNFYIQEGHNTLCSILNSDEHAEEKLNQLIDMFLEYYACAKSKGCFVSFTIQEMAQKDPDVKSILDKKYSKNFELFNQFFVQAIEKEEIKSTLSAKELTDLLDGIMLGASSLCKLPNRTEQTKNLFQIFLKQIEFIKK